MTLSFMGMGKWIKSSVSGLKRALAELFRYGKGVNERYSAIPRRSRCEGRRLSVGLLR